MRYRERLIDLHLCAPCVVSQGNLLAHSWLTALRCRARVFQHWLLAFESFSCGKNFHLIV